MFHRLLIILFFLLLFSTSCEKENQIFSGTVCLKLEHHGIPIIGATVYRNFGPNFPGYHQDMTAFYDTVAQLGLRNSVCFEGLGAGGHWFAAEGFDENIRDSVRGSLFIELGTSASEIDAILEVSEQH